MLRKIFANKEINCVKTYGERLKLLYDENLLPFEDKYQFHTLVTPKLEDSYFRSNPIIIFLGPYSTGKTTFIQYLLGEDYPSMLIGPEPTTDKFIVLMYGETNQIISGHVAALDSSKPFKSLFQNGSSFLNKFLCVEMKNELLKHITIIDTPGFLFKKEETSHKDFCYLKVIKDLVSKCERIYVLFDPYTLDFSDTFISILKLLNNFNTKLRLVFNKADILPPLSFLRLYGVLVWSLGRIIEFSDSIRIYVGSFCCKKYLNMDLKDLFNDEEIDLIKDIFVIHSDILTRRVNDLISRIRTNIASAYIVQNLTKRKSFFFKKIQLKSMAGKLENIFTLVSEESRIPLGDFPDVNNFKNNLKDFKFFNLPVIEEEKKHVLKLLNSDIPQIVDLINQEIIDHNRQINLSNGLLESMIISMDENKNNPFFEENKNGKLDIFLHHLDKETRDDTVKIEIVKNSIDQNFRENRRDIIVEVEESPRLKNWKKCQSLDDQKHEESEIQKNYTKCDLDIVKIENVLEPRSQNKFGRYVYCEVDPFDVRQYNESPLNNPYGNNNSVLGLFYF